MFGCGGCWGDVSVVSCFGGRVCCVEDPGEGGGQSFRRSIHMPITSYIVSYLKIPIIQQIIILWFHY